MAGEQRLMQNYLHDVDEIDVLYARMHRDPSPSGLLDRVYAAVAEGVGATAKILPAAQVVTELAEGAERLLRRWG